MTDIPIIEFFDDEPLITPGENYNEDLGVLEGQGVKTAIVTWLKDLAVLGEDFARSAVFFRDFAGEGVPMPSYIYKNTLVVFMCIGAPMAASVTERLGFYGIKNIIAYGTAGCIDPDFDQNQAVIVTKAIRDEGTSYHYLAPSVFVETDTEIIKIIENVLRAKKLPAKRGIVWTTDGFYRETKKRVAKRRSQGAVAVDMECSAFAAAAIRCGIRFGQFLVFSDSLVGDSWGWLKSLDERQSQKAALLSVALEMSKNLSCH